MNRKHHRRSEGQPSPPPVSPPPPRQEDPERQTEAIALREKLTRDRMTAPLFDIDRYARGLEAAFAHMLPLHREGRRPEAFAVASGYTMRMRVLAGGAE